VSLKAIAADLRERIKTEVAGWPPLVEDQRNAVATLAPSKDEADAA
jgi:hypothetical protein